MLVLKRHAHNCPCVLNLDLGSLGCLVFGLLGLESLMRRLEVVPDLLVNMDLQNVFYRYFAETARFFKKIQHSVRSGEAELLVICDGEEPVAEDLRAAFDDFLQVIRAFSSWRTNERFAVEKKLQEVMRSRRRTVASMWKLCAFMVLGAMTGYLSTWMWKLPVFLMVSGTAAGAVVMVLVGYCVECKRDLNTVQGLTALWHKMGTFESEVSRFLESLTSEIHSRTLRESLASTQCIRSQLDSFLHQLQMKGLIFTPTSAASTTCGSP